MQQGRLNTWLSYGSAQPLKVAQFSVGVNKFWCFIASDSPPPLTAADSRQRDDAAWHQASLAYRQAKAEVDAATARLEAVREALVALAAHPKESGAGVTVTRFWKAGSVDYKRVPQLQGVDLEAYRGKAREEVRVSVAA